MRPQTKALVFLGLCAAAIAVATPLTSPPDPVPEAAAAGFQVGIYSCEAYLSIHHEYPTEAFISKSQAVLRSKAPPKEQVKKLEALLYAKP